MCSSPLPTSVIWWKMSGVCSDTLCERFGHYRLRIVSLANLLEIGHPTPGMRFSGHLLLSSNWLTGDYKADVALWSLGLSKPWRHTLCNTSRTNWGNMTQTSQSCLLFTLQLLMIQDKNVIIAVLAMKWRSMISDAVRTRKKLEKPGQATIRAQGEIPAVTLPPALSFCVGSPSKLVSSKLESGY